jgi:hypothetical protein
MTALRHTRLAALLIPLAMLASAPAFAQEETRLPTPRPATAPGEAVLTWAEQIGSRFAEAGRAQQSEPEEESASVPAHAAAAIDDLIARTPKPRPDTPPALLAMVAPTDLTEAADPQPQPPIPTVTDAEHAACLGRLRILGVVFTEEEPIDPHGVCAVDRPLNVTELGKGLAIEPEAIVNCGTAESLARWAAEVMIPAADKHLKAVPETIGHGSTYVCRPRNNVAGAKLSEHARANAVDIASIAFAAREPVSIGATAAPPSDHAFEDAIREGACSYFTTVLGPGSDAAHATHLHFDMAVRRGGYRLCDLGPTVASAPLPVPNTKRE